MIRQSKLGLANKEGRRFTFREEDKNTEGIVVKLEKYKEELNAKWQNIEKVVSTEIKKCQEYLEELKKKESMWEKRMEDIENNIEELVYWIKNREGEKERSLSSELSGKRGESRYTSMGSVMSEGSLSVKEVSKLKKLVIEKERGERKNNIAIKGIVDLIEKEEKRDGKARNGWRNL